MENDIINLKKVVKKLLLFYSRRLKMKKLYYFQNWRNNILYVKKKKILKTPIKTSLRLYNHYKFKESYLEALKLLHQIKEGDNYTFQPKINNNNIYMTFKTERGIINKKIRKYNNKKKIINSSHKLSQSLSLKETKIYKKKEKKEKSEKQIKENKDKELEEEEYLNPYYMNSNIQNFNRNINLAKTKAKLTKAINYFNKSNEINYNRGYNSHRITKRPNSLYIQTNTKPSSDISSKISFSLSKKEEKSRNYKKNKNILFTPTQSTINNNNNNNGNSKYLYNQFLSQVGNKNSNSLNFHQESYISENLENKSNKTINLPVLSYLIDKKIDKNIEKNNNSNKGPYTLYDNLNNFWDSNDFSSLKNYSKDRNNNNNDNSTKMKSLISKISNDSPLNNNLIHNRIFSNPQNLKLNLDSEDEKIEYNQFTIVSGNFSINNNKRKDSFITVQSVTDEKLFKEANSYLSSDDSLENFQKNLKNYKKKISNK
jgi:hypothetical protein